MVPAAQLVLDVENAPGVLAQVAGILATAGVEIAGVWVFPCPRGGPFFRPADEDAWALAAAAERLAGAGINLICAYASADRIRQIAVILDEADVPRAAAALQGSAEDAARDRGGRRLLRVARPGEGEAGVGAVGGRRCDSV